MQRNIMYYMENFGTPMFVVLVICISIKSEPFLIKKKNLSGSRNPLALESWNHLHYHLLASLSARKSNCMAVILCWCSLESFVALWAEDFDTPGWCKDFLELVCVHMSVWYIFSKVMTVLYFLFVFPLCCVVLFTWHCWFFFYQYNTTNKEHFMQMRALFI